MERTMQSQPLSFVVRPMVFPALLATILGGLWAASVHFARLQQAEVEAVRYAQPGEAAADVLVGASTPDFRAEPIIPSLFPSFFIVSDDGRHPDALGLDPT
jgi:hypothetical protein